MSTKATTPCPACKATACVDHPEVEWLPRESRRTTVGHDGALNPTALTGSWFHRLEGGLVTAVGLVLAQVQAEPAEPTYLLEFEEGIGHRTQRLVKLGQMFPENEQYEFRFFDFEAEMREAYGASL